MKNKNLVKITLVAICAIMQDPSSGHKSAHCGFKSMEECERLSGVVLRRDLPLKYPHAEFKCQEGPGDAKEVIRFSSKGPVYKPN